MALRPLSAQTHAALRRAVDLIERDEALHRLVDLLDPHGMRSPHALAVDIAKRLNDFRETRGHLGARGLEQPSGSLEAELLRLCASGCPSEKRRLGDTLRDLGLGG